MARTVAIERRQREPNQHECDRRVGCGAARRRARIVEQQLIDPEAAHQVLAQNQRSEQRNNQGDAMADAPAKTGLALTQQQHRRPERDQRKRRIGLHLRQTREEALDAAEPQEPRQEHRTADRDRETARKHGNTHDW